MRDFLLQQFLQDVGCQSAPPQTNGRRQYYMHVQEVTSEPGR